MLHRILVRVPCAASSAFAVFSLAGYANVDDGKAAGFRVDGCERIVRQCAALVLTAPPRRATRNAAGTY